MAQDKDEGGKDGKGGGVGTEIKDGDGKLVMEKEMVMGRLFDVR